MLPPAPNHPIRALLLDVGGPLEDETAAEAAWDRAVCRAFAAEGRQVAHRLAHANRQAIRCFAPNLYRSVIHQLANGDPTLAGRVEVRLTADLPPRPPLVLRPGWEDVLRACRLAGLRVGICANQPGRTGPLLAASPLGPLFDQLTMSGDLGLRKPDPRLFLAVLAGLDCPPEAALMVGDRIDNDIAPARLLGMRAIRYRTGRHHRQRPRSREEFPDAEVTSPADLHRLLIDWGVLPDISRR